jgi:hypothetical protein
VSFAFTLLDLQLYGTTYGNPLISKGVPATAATVRIRRRRQLRRGGFLGIDFNTLSHPQHIVRITLILLFQRIRDVPRVHLHHSERDTVRETQ